MSQTGSKSCARCGGSVPADAPEGLCPRCLLALNLETQTDPGAGPGAAASAPDLAAVARLFPQLELLECLGRGGMGVVYKARQPRLDRLVALKLLASGRESDPRFAERFTREARALARLSHPNIVSVHDFGEAGGHFYLLMEFVDGLNLRQLLQAGKMTPKEALKVVPEICDALQYAHEQGIVHRDIKPENILLDKQGRVKIADFGIAKLMGPGGGAGLTGARDIVGTPHYMAPEQIEKPQEVDHRADIYSLGVVFYEMLTGELPLGRFRPPSSCTPALQLDVRLDAVVLRALEKQPERCYQAASEVKTEVETIRTTAPEVVSAASPKGGGNGLLIAAGIALVLLAAGGALVAAVWFLSAPRRVPSSASVAPAGGATVPSAPLRYVWKPGTTWVYSVQLETTGDDYIETLSGNVSYTVRSETNGLVTLSYRSHLGLPLRRPKPGRMLPASFPFSLARFWRQMPLDDSARELQVDSQGSVVSQTGHNQPLPQALGDIERLILEPLPAQAQGSWETARDCEVVLTSTEPLSPMSHFGRTQRQTLAAREEATCRLASVTGGNALIKKHYELKTQEIIAGEPRLLLTGEGTITFDTVLGLPRASQFDGTLTERTENTSLRTPLALRCRLLEGADKEASMKPAPAVRSETEELAGPALRDTLADLQSPDSVRRNVALAKLADSKPAAPSEETANLLVAALEDANWPARRNAAAALGWWGDTNAVEPLLKTLEDTEFSVRWAAMSSLAKMKAAEAAAPLAKRLSVQTDSMQAAQALQALGVIAEAPVLEVLSDSNPDAQRAACRILKEIGTQKSAAALTTAASDADPITAMLAKEALKTIEARQQSNVKAQPPAENPNPQ